MTVHPPNAGLVLMPVHGCQGTSLSTISLVSLLP